jgi:hypothetical protein
MLVAHPVERKRNMQTIDNITTRRVIVLPIALKGRNGIAQGEALGKQSETKRKPCKGEMLSKLGAVSA